MALSTQPYKGSRDFYPEEMLLRRKIFDIFRQIAHDFAFLEYDGPLLEPFELYAAKTGEEIVNQQLYHFEDRGGRKVAIRPEMTPTLARMVAAKFGELQPPLRWFSIPNLWRYERPQKGRLREHWQLNVDVLGGENHLADLEILTFVAALFDRFGCSDKLKIRINHRGWVNYYLKEVLQLDADKAHKFSKILDAKEKLSVEDFEKELLELTLTPDQRKKFDFYISASLSEMQKLYPNSPCTEIFNVLNALQREDLFVYDPCIMRGLDYYTGLVFEGFDRSPSNRRAIFGGGRYDNLIGLFGKNQLSGIGFGMGDVVLMDFLTENSSLPLVNAPCDIFVSLPDNSFWSVASDISSQLRKKNYSVMMSLKCASFKNQLKAADRSRAKWAILFGDDEWKDKKIILRDLKNSTQEVLAIDELIKKNLV